MYLDLALIAGAILVFSSIAGLIEKSWISGPIVFVLFGFLIGPRALDILSLEMQRGMLKTLAELTLALVLFNDAAGADFKALRRQIPMRMLAIGLPLTLLLGFGAGVLLFGELSIIEVAILATILAPTDAALGQAVLKEEAIPANLRQGLNFESGLNDGICVPILLVLIALAIEKATHASGYQLALSHLLTELGIGLLVGVVLAATSVHLLRFTRKQGWLGTAWIQLTVFALAITTFATAQSLGGSGFIATFCGGLLFGYRLKGEHEDLLHFGEGMSDAFQLITWVLFGAAVAGKALPNLTWPIFGYAVLSLTLLRMLPIFISLAGTGVSTEGKLFLGWFGPRGLATIVFAIMVIDINLPHGDIITTTVVFTIMLSILLHGISAKPWAKLWARK
ncbi:MAG: sodium:proton antiporter [Gammaproteobacteria bacterium]|nr:MAG: sodium:proton antiporter [Gammaproteobacteria bacterium]